MTFGSRLASHLSITGNEAYWQHIPQPIAAKLRHETIRPPNYQAGVSRKPMKRNVKSVALGVNESAVIVWADGVFNSSNTRTNYPGLYDLLQRCDRGDVVVKNLPILVSMKSSTVN
jgi:hypothetical protein